MKLLKSDVLMAVRQAVMLEIPSMAICYGRYSHIVGTGNIADISKGYVDRTMKHGCKV